MFAQSKVKLLLVVIAFALASPVAAGDMRTHPTPGLGTYDVPFYVDGTYRDDVQSPTAFFGFELGGWPLTHEQILSYFTYLSDNFSNVFLVEYATSYEGRALVYLTIASESNARNLQAIRDNTATLADPRRLTKGDDAEQLIVNTPATAWMAYGIHGNELSSCDAAVQLAYQLVAGTDAGTKAIRDQVVVCIDPLENPDGRTRWNQYLAQWNGVVPDLDTQSLYHAGLWPYGRGNHYLFDLNRDWFALVHPESRGRVDAVLDWNPQYFLDCHEMGPLDTYLFSPPREPFNPFMISQIHKWWRIVAEDQAAAFDRYGWSYYTREWNEEFFPGYGSSWGIYIGAIGMLYEQARVNGGQVKQRDGGVLSYREAVHHQFISSIANLTTVANHRQEILEDFYKEKSRAVGMENGRRKKDRAGAFVFPPAANAGRLQHLIETLQRQRIEVEVATESFKLRGAQSSMGYVEGDTELPTGTAIVRLNQPLRALIEVILTFDIRIPTKFLETEERNIIKNNRTRLYETTGWSLPLAYNVECYYTKLMPKVETRPADTSTPDARLINPSPKFGYAIDNVDDRSYRLLARLFEKGYNVWAAKKPFEVDGREFKRGSLLIKLGRNPGLDESELAELAKSEGVDIYGVNTALGSKLADLGGNEFALLQPPRIAIVGGAPTSTYEFGAVWHLLDSRLGYRSSQLDLGALARRDLRKYNVIVLPSSWQSGVFKRTLGKPGVEKLRTWVKAGGTLIAMGNSAALLADTLVAMTSVRQKRQVLGKLAKYGNTLEWARAIESPVVDSLDLWEAEYGEEIEDVDDEASDAPSAAKEADERARRLRPRGAILAAALDAEHWLAFGIRSPMPVLVSTDYVYMAKTKVQVPARFEEEDRVRLSGLLWPEARKRWSQTAYATREGLGSGQVILFATQPNFRAYFRGGERMLLNAMFLGPGFGARRPLDW